MSYFEPDVLDDLAEAGNIYFNVVISWIQRRRNIKPL